MTEPFNSAQREKFLRNNKVVYFAFAENEETIPYYISPALRMGREDVDEWEDFVLKTASAKIRRYFDEVRIAERYEGEGE